MKLVNSGAILLDMPSGASQKQKQIQNNQTFSKMKGKINALPRRGSALGKAGRIVSTVSTEGQPCSDIVRCAWGVLASQPQQANELVDSRGMLLYVSLCGTLLAWSH